MYECNASYENTAPLAENFVFLAPPSVVEENKKGSFRLSEAN